MTTKKVLFFIAGPSPTGPELTAIGKINAATEQPYSCKVFTKLASPNYGYGKEEADYVAGDVPAAYSGTAVLDPDNIPLGTPLPATSAVVANGGNVTVKNSAGTVTKTGVATVAASAISGVALAATEAIVSNAQNLTVQNSAGAAVAGNHAATVAAGVVSNVKLAATVAPVVSGLLAGIVATGSGTAVTITVTAGVITAVALS